MGAGYFLLYFTFIKEIPELEEQRASTLDRELGLEDSVKSSYPKVSSKNQLESDEVVIRELEEDHALPIVEKYRDSIIALETQATTELNRLVEEAYQEYDKNTQSEGNHSTIDLYMKYYSAAISLENKMDIAFNKLYGALERDLKSNGLSLLYAERVREKYISVKEKRKSELLKEALEGM